MLLGCPSLCCRTRLPRCNLRPCELRAVVARRRPKWWKSSAASWILKSCLMSVGYPSPVFPPSTVCLLCYQPSLSLPVCHVCRTVVIDCLAVVRFCRGTRGLVVKQAQLDGEAGWRATTASDDNKGIKLLQSVVALAKMSERKSGRTGLQRSWDDLRGDAKMRVGMDDAVLSLCILQKTSWSPSNPQPSASSLLNGRGQIAE